MGTQMESRLDFNIFMRHHISQAITPSQKEKDRVYDQLLINTACVSYGSPHLKRLWSRSVNCNDFFFNFQISALPFYHQWATATPLGNNFTILCIRGSQWRGGVYSPFWTSKKMCENYRFICDNFKTII